MTRIVQYQDQAGMANGYFIFGDKGVIAIDTGFEMGEDLFLRHCRVAGIRPEDICLIIITHGHGDHFYNIHALKKLTGAPVLIHKEDAFFIKNGELPDDYTEGRTRLGKQIFRDQETGEKPYSQAPALMPDILMEGSVYDLKPWGVDGQILWTPGHSRGSTAIVLEDGNAFVGDTFALWKKETGGGPAFLKYKGSPFEEVQGHLQSLLDLGIHTFYSGHGGPYSREYVRQKLEEEYKGHQVGDEYLTAHGFRLEDYEEN